MFFSWGSTSITSVFKFQVEIFVQYQMVAAQSYV